MKKLSIIILLLLFSWVSIFAQNPKAKDDLLIKSIQRNSAYIEIMGNAGMISLNYERLLPIGDQTGLGFRIGAGSAEALTGLLEVNFLYGRNKHFLETGLGYVNAFSYPDQWSTIKLGYRYQGKKGFLLKIAPMYIYNFEVLNGNEDVFDGFWAGACFGYSF